MYAGKRYKKDVIRYHIPFSGEADLLTCVPSTRILWTTEVIVEDSCVCFDIINFDGNPDGIKNQANRVVDDMKRQWSYVANQVNSYNSSLGSQVRNLVQARKQHLFDKNELLASLGVPLKKREGFPQTFAIPSPKTVRTIHVAKPAVTERGFKPEPTLRIDDYVAILQVIHDVGKQFERMPSTYVGKSEEELRDHFLLFLEPRFAGAATGETFNKSGKTDILIRHEGSNVFIAECKFWKGEKAFLETITQLFRYLTWRDSKAAVILFVQNRDFTSVIRTVETAAPKHPNYLGFASKQDDSWLNYRFHINGDPNREVKTAILLFHIPHT